jgi:CHASE2 domain-containing sensor protein
MAMADLRAFVSFDFDHNENEKNLFAGQARTDSPTPFTVQDWSSKSSLPQATWEAEIKKKINRTNMCVVLVGTTMASATGVAKEITMAKEQDVPVFGVYVGGATSTSTLPAGLARSRTVAWKWDTVAEMVDQCMTEGKNAA